MTRTILITGASGQVGWELARTLQGFGRVVAPPRARLDLADLDRLADAIAHIAPDMIVNAAAYTAVDQAESEPALAQRINAEAPRVLAEAAARRGALLVHYSTDYVFDGVRSVPYIEDDATQPLNVYGQTKLDGERAVQASGAAHLILRTSWVYGMRGRNFLLTVLRLARERPELRIVADQYGAPTWCRTVAEVTAQVLASRSVDEGIDAWHALSGVYHLTARGETTWHGFTQAILTNARVRPTPPVVPIATADYPTPARRPARAVLDSGKLERTFGVCLPDWKLALQLCLDGGEGS